MPLRMKDLKIPSMFLRTISPSTRNTTSKTSYPTRWCVFSNPSLARRHLHCVSILQTLDRCKGSDTKFDLQWLVIIRELFRSRHRQWEAWWSLQWRLRPVLVARRHCDLATVLRAIKVLFAIIADRALVNCIKNKSLLRLTFRFGFLGCGRNVNVVRDHFIR